MLLQELCCVALGVCLCVWVCKWMALAVVVIVVELYYETIVKIYVGIFTICRWLMLLLLWLLLVAHELCTFPAFLVVKCLVLKRQQAGWLAVWLTSCLVVVVAVVRVIAIFCVAYIRFALKVNFCDVVVVVIAAAVVIVIIIVNFYTQLQFRLHFNQPAIQPGEKFYVFMCQVQQVGLKVRTKHVLSIYMYMCIVYAIWGSKTKQNKN